MNKDTMMGEESKDLSTQIKETARNLTPGQTAVAATAGVAVLYLLFKKRKNNKPSLFRQYVMPFVMAAAYKKAMDVAQHISFRGKTATNAAS